MGPILSHMSLKKLTGRNKRTIQPFIISLKPVKLYTQKREHLNNTA